MTLKAFQNMRIEKASDLFYESVLVKPSNDGFILNTALSRKQKHPNSRKIGG